MTPASHSRQRYLAALGIVRYVPRDIPAEPVQEQPAVEPEQASAPPALRRDPPKPKAAASTESEPVPPVEELSFRLAFWQPSPQLIVLSSLPPGRRTSEEEVVMLQRLLQAIRSLPGELPASEWIDWPLAPGAASDLAGAREMLGVFLDVKARLQPFATALLMGDAAARVAGGRDTFRVGDRVPLACGAEGVVTHSLHEMARDASLKRPTWDTLQSLVIERPS